MSFSSRLKPRWNSPGQTDGLGLRSSVSLSVFTEFYHPVGFCAQLTS